MKITVNWKANKYFKGKKMSSPCNDYIFSNSVFYHGHFFKNNRKNIGRIKKSSDLRICEWKGCMKKQRNNGGW